jgi:hypothetical protein
VTGSTAGSSRSRRTLGGLGCPRHLGCATDLRVGQTVQVTFAGALAESYPELGTARTIVIVD